MMTEEVVRGCLDAYAAGDIDRMVAHAVPDVRYRVVVQPAPGVMPFDVTGRAALAEAMAAWTRLLLIERFEIVDLIVADDRAASQQDIAVVVRETGERLESTVALFWWIRDGRLSRLVEFHDSAMVARVRG